MVVISSVLYHPATVSCPHANNQSPAVAQVEKTPAVIKAGLKKEDAEALKAKLEAGE